MTRRQKQVERRRGNINEGINELGRIVPSGSGEKAKGAIVSRAVQYIHHLKENEARNIEKWTLEKLLMDQAWATCRFNSACGRKSAWPANARSRSSRLYAAVRLLAVALERSVLARTVEGGENSKKQRTD